MGSVKKTKNKMQDVEKGKGSMTELRWGAIRPPGWVWGFGERLGLGGELCSERGPWCNLSAE